jgi:dienelactone hydrolase
MTPTLLRNPDGSVLRQDGKLRLWFASTDFTAADGLHTLHETTSENGIHWSTPSPAQYEGIYAPTILKEDGIYRMWYSDVSAEPWIVRHAQSTDGKTWERSEAPCVVIDQPWEKGRLFYPAVIKHGGRYVMWYGSYWAARENTTAIGVATSEDGLTWTKGAENPVMRPDEARPWESHYTTSQSVLKLDDGSWRMWYATRKAPPFENKYFAIGTARWRGPDIESATWPERATELRAKMAAALTLPVERIPMDAQTHKTTPGDGYTIESVTYASEPGSRVTALLYLPQSAAPVPAVIVACGHGGSKSALYAQYAGQLYAKMGFACLAVDTIGEEERHGERRMGARGHDLYHLPKEERASFMEEKMKRSILGKIVWDLMRGADYLESRPEIDGSRLGIVGYSLGGASAGCVAILDSRIKSAVIAGWGFLPSLASYGKPCTRVPYHDFSEFMDFTEMTALLAPHAATLFFNGTTDSIIDPEENGALLVKGATEGVAGAKLLLEESGVSHALAAEFVEGACHRPYFLTPRALQWMQQHLGVDAPPIASTIRYGDWVAGQGREIEKLYNTEAREPGTIVVDVGAVYREPVDLACLPLEGSPPAEYTFEGWMAQCVELAR